MSVVYIKENKDLSCDVEVEGLAFNVGPKLKHGVLVSLSEQEAIQSAKSRFDSIQRKKAFRDKEIRAERNEKLLATDWIVTKSLEAGVAVPQEWLDYRQALRDLPQQTGFPDSITWPTAPNEESN